ncbi:hypothetical protein K435DRAFT_834658 [Dendrothele bispora CBS 962.96]|uniref:Uncharacterized protein n=1 Tax=Dendrothele bispora (strain CBS 962.96) TaxID=1314807 RepID=A0A4V4HI73_DENBC|nr:hypothetical protein K435DRAFT_834658 [Dendrothele bispora CBS 962.96]
MDALKVELRDAQASITKMESTRDLSSVQHTKIVMAGSELSDEEFVETLDKLLGHVDMAQVHADPVDCISETELDTEGALAMVNTSQFEFLKAPLDRRDTTWHLKRLDVVTALEDELCRAQHAEILEERELFRLQVLVERARLKVMVQRALAQKKKERREMLARASHELRRQLKNTRFHL